MRNRNWKLLGLWLTLAMLCACLFGASALAEAKLTLTVADGDGQAEAVTVEGDEVSGSWCYRVYMEIEDADAFQFTMETDDGGEPQNWDEIPWERLRPDDEGNRYFTFTPNTEEGETLESETAFFRLPGEADYQKYVFNYNTSDAVVSIDDADAPRLLEDFRVYWNPEFETEDHDVYYQLYWWMPNGNVHMDETRKTEFGIDEEWDGGPAETLNVVGEYRLQVIPIVDGAMGQIATATYDVEAPEGDGRVNLSVDVEPDDALLTLSTCLDDDRLVVLARRLRPGESKDAVVSAVEEAYKS